MGKFWLGLLVGCIGIYALFVLVPISQMIVIKFTEESLDYLFPSQETRELARVREEEGKARELFEKEVRQSLKVKKISSVYSIDKRNPALRWRVDVDVFIPKHAEYTIWPSLYITGFPTNLESITISELDNSNPKNILERLTIKRIDDRIPYANLPEGTYRFSFEYTSDLVRKTANGYCLPPSTLNNYGPLISERAGQKLDTENTANISLIINLRHSIATEDIINIQPTIPIQDANENWDKDVKNLLDVLPACDAAIEAR